MQSKSSIQPLPVLSILVFRMTRSFTAADAGSPARLVSVLTRTPVIPGSESNQISCFSWLHRSILWRDNNHAFGLRVKVGTIAVVLIGNPEPLDITTNRLRCFHIGADDKTIKASGFIDKLRRRVKASSTIHGALGLSTLPLLPNEVLIGVHSGIEWNHRGAGKHRNKARRGSGIGSGKAARHPKHKNRKNW